MKNINKLFILILSCAFSVLTLTTLSAQDRVFSADGPYIQYISADSARVISVDEYGNISDKRVPSPRIGDIIHVTEHSGQWSFDVTLKESVRHEWKVPASDSIFVMSDPHGRIDCMIELLQRWNVIDNNLNWSYGSNQLIVIGDACDRGEDATQIYWLLYKLEDEAEAAGGRMTFLYGNHEPMILSGDYRYSKPKYTALADSLGTTYRDLMGQNTELGKWLATRNTIQVIGDNLFVHAGISPQLLEWNLDIPEINEILSSLIFTPKEKKKELPELENSLLTTFGPLWYRGMVESNKSYPRASRKDVQNVLQRYEVSHIFVGHTIFRNVRNFYGGLLTAVNVDNPANCAANRTRAAIIVGDRIAVVR